MIFKLLSEGVLIGFMASLLLGPTGILVIQRTVNQNQLSGMLSGMGAAISDTIYAGISGFSVAVIFHFIRQYEIIFKTGISVILLMLGLVILLSNPEKYSGKQLNNSKNYFKNFVTTFLVAASNPLIMFVHISLFAVFGIALDINNPMSALFILCGFFVGALIWWFSLTGVISKFKNKISKRIFMQFNRIAGSTIILIVLISLAYFFWV
ncbi:MAG TPA: LysE family transporter [Tangfeifania sp.]|nr:LysE family transporter [Tangfeifania sp.]